MNFLRSMRSKVFRLLFALLLISSAVSAGEQGFRWYDDEDYKPYIYKDKDGAPKGIFRDLMVEIFKRLDIPLTIKLFPWKRTQVFVHNGLADGMVTAVTQKRLETMVATDPLVISKEKIFSRRDNPRIEQIKQIRSIDGMKDFSVVEVVGSGWAEERFRKLPHVVWVPKLDSALYMLANGRVDIYVMNEFSGVELIRAMMAKPSPFQDNFKKIVVSPNTLGEIRYSLLINKNSQWAGLVPRINATLEAIKRDGTYDRILKRYLTLEGQ